MHHAIINTMIFLGIVFGVIECFFGYRIFKIILGILGFAAGASLAMLGGNAMSPNEIILFLSGLVGGIIGAVMMVWMYFFGVFMIGALAGGVIGNAIFSAAQMYPATFAVLVIAVCCGVLALIFQKFMIIFATAFIGSWHLTAGISCFLGGAGCPMSMDRWLQPGAIHSHIVTLIWLFLGFFGFMVQYKLVLGENRPEPSDSGNSPRKKKGK